MEEVKKEYVYKTENESRKKYIKDFGVNEVFGWQEVEESKDMKIKTYRREKSTMHDSELHRLEKRINSLIDSVIKSEKTIKKSIKSWAYFFGVVSTLILGAGMSFLMAFAPTQINMIIGIVLGVTGLVCCAVNYSIYKKVSYRKISKLQPQIVENKEKILNILEQVKLLQRK